MAGSVAEATSEAVRGTLRRLGVDMGRVTVTTVRVRLSAATSEHGHSWVTTIDAATGLVTTVAMHLDWAGFPVQGVTSVGVVVGEPSPSADVPPRYANL